MTTCFSIAATRSTARSALRVDPQMRPLGPDGEPVLDNVTIAGHLMPGFNPLTDGCAEGIVLATALKAALKAVNAALAPADN